MKKWMRGIRSKVTEKTEQWLYREEYAEAERKQAEFTAHMIEKHGPLIEFLKEVIEEDLTAIPTGEDIDRYYWLYSRAMAGRAEYMKEHHIWGADEVILTAEEYEVKAKEGKWTFLRTSVHLPVCPIDKPRPGNWRTPDALPHSVPPVNPHVVPNEKKDGWNV